MPQGHHQNIPHWLQAEKEAVLFVSASDSQPVALILQAIGFIYAKLL